MPRTTPLVCQYLEQISRKVLEEYQDIIRDYTRNRHGIYDRSNTEGKRTAANLCAFTDVKRIAVVQDKIKG